MTGSQHWARLLVEAGYEVHEYPDYFAVMTEETNDENEGENSEHEDENSRTESDIPDASEEKTTYHCLHLKIALTLPKCDKLVSAILKRIKDLLNR